MQLKQIAMGVLNTAGLSVGSIVTTIKQTGLPPYSGLIAWTVTTVYGVILILRCLPQLTDLAVAAWRIVRYWDWSRWWKIAGRTEEGGDL